MFVHTAVLRVHNGGINTATGENEMQITYKTWCVAIDSGNGLKFFDIVACDAQAAISDCKATYGDDVEIASIALISW
jgi:glutamate synthase domain-containing protein 1